MSDNLNNQLRREEINSIFQTVNMLSMRIKLTKIFNEDLNKTNVPVNLNEAVKEYNYKLNVIKVQCQLLEFCLLADTFKNLFTTENELTEKRKRNFISYSNHIRDKQLKLTSLHKELKQLLELNTEYTMTIVSEQYSPLDFLVRREAKNDIESDADDENVKKIKTEMKQLLNKINLIRGLSMRALCKLKNYSNNPSIIVHLKKCRKPVRFEI